VEDNPKGIRRLAPPKITNAHGGHLARRAHFSEAWKLLRNKFQQRAGWQEIAFNQNLK
jgi:hypothetical protein